jgi:hypothetical protein
LCVCEKRGAEMEGTVPLPVPAQSTLVKWLAKEGEEVAEDAPVAELLAPSAYSRAPSRAVLRAPVTGRLQGLQSLESACIVYCTHSIIFSGLCSICAADVSRLPSRTRKLWENHHADAAGGAGGAGGASAKAKSKAGARAADPHRPLPAKMRSYNVLR